MSANGIEEFVGLYLSFIKGCDFVKFNQPYIAKLDCQNKQQNMGEVDVVGINIKEKKLYICEVTAEIQGMGESNFNKYTAEDATNKFNKNKNFFSNQYPDLTIEYMLWFPFSPSKERMQILKHRLQEQGIRAYYENEFLEEIEHLKLVLSENTSNLSNPLARFLQIYGRLQKKYKKN